MIKVVENRKIFYVISIIFLIVSIVSFFTIKLNFGIDMTGGTQSEFTYRGNFDLEGYKEIANNVKNEINTQKNAEVMNTIDVYKVVGQDKFNVVAGFDTSLEKNEINSEETNSGSNELESYKSEFRTKILEEFQKVDPSIEETKYTNIGKTFGDYIKNTAITTLLIAVIAIALYLARAFSGILSGRKIILSFSLIVIITLTHDIIISTGLYVIISNFFHDFKIDTYFITALLTILGYSVNDTIVIFDKIRHNLKANKKGKVDLKNVINLSVNQTITRTIYTSLLIIFVLVPIFLYGPETIKGFIITMTIGTLAGTYSSVFISTSLLYELNKNGNLEFYEKKVIKDEDKYVV